MVCKCWHDGACFVQLDVCCLEYGANSCKALVQTRVCVCSCFEACPCPHPCPFRYCLGANLATTEMLVMVAELTAATETHDLIVQAPSKWTLFPNLKPDNGLPARLVPKGQGTGAKSPRGRMPASRWGEADG